MKTEPQIKPPPEDGSDVGQANDYVVQLIAIQSELRVFIHHLAPYSEARDDVLQEVNMLLLERRDRFTPGTNFRAWAFRFARNAVMNHNRKRKREQRYVFNSELVDILAEENEAEDVMADRRMTALEGCLEGLDDNSRDLLLSRYREHGAIQEAAGRMQRQASSLRTRIFRMRIALRRCIETRMGKGVSA